MLPNEKVLATFQTRVRQMILQYKEIKKENGNLYAMIDEQEQRIKQLEAELAQKEQDYKALKMARMVQITDGDLETTKARIAHLIRDIDKCITILSDEK